jgi:acylaminoacyl-peptidase
MRNPVINITTMSATTDIPDWCYVEALGSDMKYYDLDNSNVDVMNQMYLSSPIRYVDQMKAATLILLGREDRRVPMAQGREVCY